MQNLRILVCDSCLDEPFEPNRTIILPPDPVPIMNPRPEFSVLLANPISPIAWDAMSAAPNTVLTNGANIGNMTGGGSLDAAWVGTPQKTSQQGALIAQSNLGPVANWIGKYWSAINVLEPNLPPQLTNNCLQYAIGSFTLTAPTDQSFFAASIPTQIQLQGWDGTQWNNCWTGNSVGTAGETVTVASSQMVNTNTFYAHAVTFVGDGLTPIGVASIQLNALGYGVRSACVPFPPAPTTSSASIAQSNAMPLGMP